MMHTRLHFFLIFVLVAHFFFFVLAVNGENGGKINRGVGATYVLL